MVKRPRTAVGRFEFPQGHHRHGNRVKLKPRVKEVTNGKHGMYMPRHGNVRETRRRPAQCGGDRTRALMLWCQVCSPLDRVESCVVESRIGNSEEYLITGWGLVRKPGHQVPRELLLGQGDTGVRRYGLDTNNIRPLPMRAAERDLDLVLILGTVVVGGGHAVQHAVDVVLANDTPRPRRQAQPGRHRQGHMQARRRGGASGLAW